MLQPALTDTTLRDLLESCCDCGPWIDAVMRAAPFTDAGVLLDAADAAWAAVPEEALAEALDRNATAIPDTGDTNARAAAGVALGLYRERFGRAFVCAQDCETADELLMRVRIRLGLAGVADWRASCEALRRRTRHLLEQRLEP